MPVAQPERFPIGAVAQMFHLSVSTLRKYEKMGLLTPEYIAPDSGYRYYGVRQFEVLNTIRYLRALDMPLLQIADFLRNRDVPVIAEKLPKSSAKLTGGWRSCTTRRPRRAA